MRIEFYEDKAGEWRWRAIAANGRTIADSAEGYSNRADCEGGLVALAQGLRLQATQVVEISGGGGRTEGYLHALVDQVEKRAGGAVRA